MSRTPLTASVLAGLSLAGTLAGCSAGATGPAAPAGGVDYVDGEYSATGEYQSPNGTETIDVALTLEDSVVTEVRVTPHPTNPNTERFQGQFAEGIADVVVGRRIDELDVTRVAGSSLTSGGFHDALEQIKADARP